VLLGLIGAGYAGASVQGNALRQWLVPSHLLGRVSSVHRTVAVGAAPLGALVGGVVAAQLGIRAPYLLGGVALLAAGLLGVRLLSQRRDASTGPAGGERTSAARGRP
jgi:predicted MFS family arabinose efflux permease